MSYETIIRLALEKGLFFPTSEIYSNTTAGFWEYGPLGVALVRKFVAEWRRELVKRDGMIEIDGAQIMPKKVFESSGHLRNLVDPISKCIKCGFVIRVDKLISEKVGKVIPEGLDEKEFDNLIQQHQIVCPNCKSKLGSTSKFNMMFKIGIGPQSEEAYLRPETCQSIFVDFNRLFKIMRLSLPVGVAQIGKSFRNEISPRQSLIRQREFYQAEIEIFFNPMKTDLPEKYPVVASYRLRLLRNDVLETITCDDAISRRIIPNKLVAYYLSLLQKFFEKTGIDMTRTRFRQLEPKDRAFYANATFDFEVETSLGWIELVACNYRTDHDLSTHSKMSGQDLGVMDGNDKVLPHVFELSLGVDRSIYCILEHSFRKEKDRETLILNPQLAPVFVGVFPLVNKDGLDATARGIYSDIMLDFDVIYDDSGSIGRRYRRADQIGIPIGLTVDYQTLQDDTVTLRDRDSMKQVRVGLKEVREILQAILRGQKYFTS